MTIRYLLSFALLIFGQASFAQLNLSWIEKFQHSGSTGYSNESRKIAVDSSGNVFVAADLTSNLDSAGNPAPSTRHYAVILKYSVQGALLATRLIDVKNHLASGFDNPGVFGLAIDPFGDVAIGYVRQDSATGYNVVLAKYTNALAHKWTSVFNPTSDDAGVAMALESSKGIYALVASTIGTGIRYRLIHADGNAASFSNDVYGFNPGSDVINSLYLDGNGDLLVTGHRIVAGFKNLLTAKITSMGGLAWQNVYNGGSANRDNVGYQVTMGAADVFVCGVSDRQSPTNNDALVARYDAATGSLSWIKYFDHLNGDDHGRFLFVTPGKFLVVGIESGNNLVLRRLYSSSGFSSNTVEKYVYQPVPVETHTSLNGLKLADMLYSDFNRLYVVGSIKATNASSQVFSAVYLARFRVSNSGRVQAAFVSEGAIPVTGSFTDSEVGTAVAIHPPSKSVFVLGDLVSTFGNHASEQIGLSSFQAPNPLRLSAAEDLAEESVSLWPVPAHDRVTVSAGEPLAAIRVMDLTGKTVIEVLVPENVIDLSVENLPQGLYMLRATFTDGSENIKKLLKN